MPDLIEDMRIYWNAACQYDGINPTAGFVAWSKDNPWAGKYNDVALEFLAICQLENQMEKK